MATTRHPTSSTATTRQTSPHYFEQALPPRPQGRKFLGGYSYNHWLVKLAIGIIIGIIVGIVLGVIIHFARKHDKDD